MTDLTILSDTDQPFSARRRRLRGVLGSALFALLAGGLLPGCPLLSLPPADRCANVACPSGTFCNRTTGACQPPTSECPPGLSKCGSGCVDINADPAHCGMACVAGNVCTGGRCVSTPSQPVGLSNLAIRFHTNNDDKDSDTGLTVQIQGVAAWEQSGGEKYGDNSDVVKQLVPSSVKLDDVRGKTLMICITPNGNDTWKFNYHLSAARSDGGSYVFVGTNLRLTQDERCHTASLP